MKKVSLITYPLLLVFLLFAQSVHADVQAEKSYTNSIGIQFALVPAGSFMMGAHEFEGGNDNEKPQHKVTISRPFYLGIYEVTQEQWLKVTGSNPSEFQARNKPVETVSWEDIQVFIRKLNKMENTDKYRLPTEAEWEYAARAGTDTTYCYGDDPDAEQLYNYGWYGGNGGSKTKIVGRLKPNAWGLYDMHGNVWEWVQDWYAENYYSNSPSTDPEGPSSGSYRVARGGHWGGSADYCRSASRNIYPPGDRSKFLGFRLLRTP